LDCFHSQSFGNSAMDDDGETVNVFPDSSIGRQNMLLSRDMRFWKVVYYKIAELLQNGIVAKTKV
jgi:hypothetical protein